MSSRIIDRTPQYPSHAFQLPIERIRFGEFDFGGVLYHANYFHLYEMGREAMLISGGYPYTTLVDQGIHLVIVETQQHFFQPIRYGEPLTLYLWITKPGAVGVTFNYEITNARHAHSNAVCHRALTRVGLVEYRDGKGIPKRLPLELKHFFAKYAVE